MTQLSFDIVPGPPDRLLAMLTLREETGTGDIEPLGALRQRLDRAEVVGMTELGRVPELLAALEADAATAFPRFPAQAQLALRNERVVEAVNARGDRGQTVTDVRPLPYHAPSGLLFVVFDFAPAAMLAQGREAMLVVLTGSAEVVAILDPFDPRQPNPAMPPQRQDPSTDAALPFALARPSATETVRFSSEELAPVEMRTSAFLQRVGVGGVGGVAGGLGGGVFATDGTTRTQISTQTVYHHGGWTPGPFTWVEYDEKVDDIMDDAIA
jgi:hypothetical protein